MTEWLKDFSLALAVFFVGSLALIASLFGAVWLTLSAAAWAGFPPAVGAVGALAFCGAAILAACFASRDRRLDRL